MSLQIKMKILLPLRDFLEITLFFTEMKLDFDNIAVSELPEFKGGEKSLAANMFFDGTNRIFKGMLEPGASIGYHTHEDSCEVIFILEGEGTLVEKDKTTGEETVSSVMAGDCLYCQKGGSHSLKNTAQKGNLMFYAVVAKQ